MDLRSRMHRISWEIALATALCAMAASDEKAAAVVTATAQMVLYLLAGAFVRPLKSAWPSGTRRHADARRWALAGLCGAAAGAGAQLLGGMLPAARLGAVQPLCMALIAALAARSAAVEVFNQRTRCLAGMKTAGGVCALAFLLLCL